MARHLHCLAWLSNRITILSQESIIKIFSEISYTSNTALYPPLNVTVRRVIVNKITSSQRPQPQLTNISSSAEKAGIFDWQSKYITKFNRDKWFINSTFFVSNDTLLLWCSKFQPCRSLEAIMTSDWNAALLSTLFYSHLSSQTIHKITNTRHSIWIRTHRYISRHTIDYIINLIDEASEFLSFKQKKS